MSIVKTMTQSDFQDALKGNGFSYDGTEALYNFYEELSDDAGTPFEFDRVAIYCDWSEYDNAQEAYEEYADEDASKLSESGALDYLQDNTTAIQLDNGHVLVEAF